MDGALVVDALVTQSQSSMKNGFMETFGYVFDILS
jgi:hypothetical protein